MSLDPGLFHLWVQAPSLLPGTLIVTCHGVLSWTEALADMLPTPQMVCVSWETSVGVGTEV